MVASLSAALEMAKKASGKGAKGTKGGKSIVGKASPGGLIHPSFPPQAAAQPNFMGSQSMAPGPGAPPGMGPSMSPDQMDDSNGAGY